MGQHQELHRELGIPIGLIHTSWGGTAAELWTSRRVLEADPEFKPMIEQQEARVKAFAEASEKAKAEGKASPKKPGPGPAQLYNGMIAPLAPFAVQGAIWYQGESDAGRALQYRKLFPTMIRSWREAWGQGDFPFLFVQLPCNGKDTTPVAENGWPWLREAQLMTLKVPRTAMAFRFLLPMTAPTPERPAARCRSLTTAA